MGSFEFLSSLREYGRGRSLRRRRLDARHRFLVAPYRDEIRGARVLDLGAHDGRWAYALAAAGAAEVVAVEARARLVRRFAAFPDPVLRARVRFREGDVFARLEEAVAAGERFDIVAVFGLLYHLMDHHRLLLLIRRLGPRLVLVDGEFDCRKGPVIQLVRERTARPLNAAPQFPGQQVGVKGIPSFAALEVIADTLGYAATWADWSALPEDAREGVGDYFWTGPTRRGTCALRPRGPVNA
jgi:hypothetical protein